MTFATGFRGREEKVRFDARPLGPDVDRCLDLCSDASELRICEPKRRKGIAAGAA